MSPGEPLLRWAASAGGHALPLYFLLLTLLLCASVFGGRAFQRTSPPMGPRLAIGGTVMALGALVFVALATQLGTGTLLDLSDQAFTDALRASVQRPTLQVFGLLTHLGDRGTLIGLGFVVAIALFAAGRRGLAAGWVLAMAGNGVLNPALKQVFGRSRPLHPDGGLFEPGYSFPSGHSSGAVVACGMLAYLALRLLPPRWHVPAAALAVALAFTVGASRVFLRVHFASDVLAGFASGAFWLALCVTGIEWMRRIRTPAQPRQASST
jgi:undecaprenyl-diphosphatase